LGISLGLTLGFAAIEAVAGLLANSLALLTDAAHNFTDAITLALSWFAQRMQSRPAGATNTFGYHRVGILVALINSTTLVLISLGVFYEAYRRLIHPTDVQAQALIIVGLLAVVVNAGTALMIRRKGERDLNLRSAFTHLMGDVASTSAAVVAGVIMYATGAKWLDPVVSALIGVLILRSAWTILREAVEILLESTPRDVNMPAMVADMMRIPGVMGVHDLHVWSLTNDLRSMSAHVLTEDVTIGAGAKIQARLSQLLAADYRIAHATLQLECVDCGPGELYCELDDVEFAQLK
jgi:cobalt-zinc-cadmium efflux system protein